MSDQSLLSVTEAAQRLKRSTEQVRRYLREGRLDGRRIGGQWFIERERLTAFERSLQEQQSFVHRLKTAAELRALDDIVGIGRGMGTNIGEGKAAYRRAARWRR
ncbi:MAG: helix-turn-helix domain-containing protein [Chloroflexota bacterium]|nr:helix-turn-helix domain-containing protein [Chloroflexota bacterium]